MNVGQPKTIVLLGFLSHFPVAGVAWQTVHYLLGFRRLGFEVYYVEAHGCAPSKLMQRPTDDGPRRAAEYIERTLRRFDLGDRWAYHSLYPEPRFFGLNEAQLHHLYRSAAWLINLHGSHLPSPELVAGGRLVYLETDPVEVEIDLFHGCAKTRDYLAPHCAFFTYGENLGRPDCRVPYPEPFKFLPTRQPVVLDLWPTPEPTPVDRFTTIGNWRQPWREISFQGETYRWSKHFEFEKFIGLPRRCTQDFELALSGSSMTPEDRRTLEGHGWHIRDALEFSHDVSTYRRYITESRGEFTVAKDQNVRLRSGWFSDRAATYLAAGRPVISQDTAFDAIFPTGKGLFSFNTLDDILSAVEAINSDYPGNRTRAREIAHEFFDHQVVLGQLLRELGESLPRTRPHPLPCAKDLPDTLIVQPASRWPTRLPETTWQIASTLPVPTISPLNRSEATRTTLILVTHNRLPYTKLCLTSLLSRGWDARDEILVIDNDSTDGTPEFLVELAATLPFIRMVRNPQNRGFAAANNQGLAIARGRIFILLNNDTLVSDTWLERLAQRLEDPDVGLVGPVTNRTCNEAQIDAPYRTYGELRDFAERRAQEHAGQAIDLSMLAMFCLALRREVFECVGPLDEQFEIGMFEDDDYARRVAKAGYRIVCAEDVFVHHFGQASLGELCRDGHYDRVLASNRRRFEAKWNVSWQPHLRRITPEYHALRARLLKLVAAHIPDHATVVVVSKGDDELLKLSGQTAWHFPRTRDGAYANLYPADSAEAIAHLEELRTLGAKTLVIPEPALWWLDFYDGFAAHLRSRYSLIAQEPGTGLVFDLESRHA